MSSVSRRRRGLFSSEEAADRNDDDVVVRLVETIVKDEDGDRNSAHVVRTRSNLDDGMVMILLLAYMDGLSQ